MLKALLGGSRVDMLSRLSIFIVFFWFGVLKVLGVSPADGLVEALHAKTIPFLPFASFFVILGLWEMAIGILFLLPKFTKYAFYLFIAQMATTFLPLLLTPDLVWQAFLVPNLVGQYIIKNVMLVALGLQLYTKSQH